MSEVILFFGATQIGKAPLKWGKCKIDDNLVDILGGFSCARTQTVSSGVPHLRPMNISTNGEVILTADTQHIRPDFRNDVQTYYLDPGDVLYNNTNSVELVGKNRHCKGANARRVSNHINRLRIRDRSKIDPKWLALALRNLQEQGFFAAHCNKWIGQAGFSVSALSEVEIPLPYPDDPPRSLAEQQRIVARIEALFAELRECRRLHGEVVKDTGRLMEAVLAEVYATEVMQRWPFWNNLSELVEINAPMVDPTQPQYQDMPHINGEVIEQGTGHLLPHKSAAEDRMRSSKYLFQPGSILYSKIRPYLRKVAVADFAGLCSADMYPLELKTNKIDREFLKWALLAPHFTNYAVGESGRARMPKINRPQLYAYRLYYPHKNEQQAIADFLASVQTEIAEMSILDPNVKTTN